MDERIKFIDMLLTSGRTMTEVCDIFNVSRKTGHKWRGRFFADARRGLKDRSRAALSHPDETDFAAKELLLSARRRNRKTPAYDHPFINCASPNAVWSADFKGQFKVGDPDRQRRSVCLNRLGRIVTAIYLVDQAWDLS